MTESIEMSRVKTAEILKVLGSLRYLHRNDVRSAEF